MFLPGIVVWGPVPWGANMAYLDINVGVLYLIAMSSLSTLAVFLAGWSSNNHYALLGAMRTVAMMISYEIPLSLALLSVVLMTGTMQLSGIVAWQADHNLWLIALMPFALFCFLFSSTAELNRSPNDIAEAESEIVAGYFTEYSGIKAGLFMAVELGNAVAISALVSTFFLGGWTLFGLEEWIPGYLILAGKISVLYFFFVWTRASLPRMRLDLLMGFAWKFLIPLALVQAFVVAVEAAVFARWDIEGIVPLGIFVVVNIAATVWAIRRWSDLLGYRPEPAPERRVLIAVEIGGLRAANRLHGGSSQGTR
jgi:NADH-quinone oxidoreductase subunit H